MFSLEKTIYWQQEWKVLITKDSSENNYKFKINLLLSSKLIINIKFVDDYTKFLNLLLTLIWWDSSSHLHRRKKKVIQYILIKNN